MNKKMIKLAIAAVILVAVFIGFLPTGGSSVYADVVKQLQKARTFIYTVTTSTPVEGMPEMEMEIAFKEPGYMRLTMPGGYVSVMDSIQGKGLSIIPARQQYIEIDMANLPDDAARKQIEVIENLKTLPERADEDLGEQTMDSRTVHGFRVNENSVTHTVWIDPKTRELVLVEMEFDNAPGMSGTMSNFKFDVELDDSLFSLMPPDGYSRLELQVDVSEAGEDNLIEYLRLWTGWTKDKTFPPTLNPVELAKVSMEMAKSGGFKPEQPTKGANLKHVMKMTRGLMFVTYLPAESNWRYAGENVQYGDTNTPIFWYRPTGSQTYRVIYGDLNVKDVAPEDLPN